MKIDVVVIGAGCVGLSCAAKLADAGRSVVLFERHPSFGQETSSRNSEVIHAGIYYAKGSLKAKLCVEGRRELYSLCEAEGVPYRKCGKIIVAVDESEMASIENLMARGRDNGVENLRMLSAGEVRQYEPEVRVVGGLLSPETGIVDSHRLMETYVTVAEERGADIVYGAAVESLERCAEGWRVGYRDSEESAEVVAEVVVNAAGLWSQEVMKLAGLDPNSLGLTRYLAKGEYFSIGGEKRKRVSMLIYPSPESNLVGLGIHTVVDLGGGLKLGPNAEYVEEIEYAVDPEHASAFHESAAKYLPWLEAEDLAPDMAGMRPKLSAPGEEARDFHLAEESGNGAPGFINLAGIESPGLTASLAIGGYVKTIVDGVLNN